MGFPANLHKSLPQQSAGHSLFEAEVFTLQDSLVEEIVAALSLRIVAVIGGPSRKLAAPAERARSAVTLRIRSAIKKIEAAHPELARHFANSIRTGTFCSYAPEKPIDWTI